MSELDPFEGIPGLIFYANRQHNGYTFSMNATSVKRVRSLKARGVVPTKVFISWDDSKTPPLNIADFFAVLTDAQRDGLALMLTGMKSKRRTSAGGLKFVEVIGGVYGQLVSLPEVDGDG